MKPRKSLPRNKESVAPFTLSMRIQPRASKNEILMMEDGGLKVRLTAPPVEGAANAALVKFLATELCIAKSQVEIVSGLISRGKIVRIDGISRRDIERLLNKPKG